MGVGHRRESVADTARRLLGGFLLAISYVFSAARRNRQGVCVGIATVALVVGFTSLLQSSVQHSPLIFLKLAEDSVGENDVVYIAEVSNTSTSPLVNFTDVSHTLADSPDVKGAAPRWLLIGSLENVNDPDLNTSVIVLALDSELEEAAGLGRDWTRRPLGVNEAYISSSALTDTNTAFGVGAQATIVFDWVQLVESLTSGPALNPDGISQEQVSELLDSFGIDLGTITIDGSPALRSLLRALGLSGDDVPDVLIDLEADLILAAALNATIASNLGANGNLALRRDVTVLDTVGKPNGKWPVALGNVVILEAKHLTTWAKSFIIDALDFVETIADVVGLGQDWVDAVAPLRRQLDDINYDLLKQYAMQTVVQYTKRDTLYIQTAENIKSGMIDFTNDLGDLLGVNYPVQVSAPLAIALEGTQFIRIFLDQIFGAVVFLLVMLGLMVIYALILGDVEAKTYEMGMLRVMGLPHTTLAQLLGVQAALFSIPGILVGLSVASILNVVAAKIVSDFAGVDAKRTMPGSAWILGVVIGALMPTLANIVPIRRALSSTLRDAIDMYHQTFNEVKVTLIKLEKLGISTWQLMLAVVMVLTGFTTYYLIPLAFVLRNFTLFLSILNAILLGMLLGLTLVGQSLQASLERLVVWLILWGPEKTLWTVVTKNLAGHRSRNKKSALMISVAIAFLLFAGAMFALQAESIKDNVRLFVGADLMILDTQDVTSDTQLPQEDLREFLTSLTVESDAGPPVVAGFTFVTYALNELGDESTGRVINLANEPDPEARVYGVQSNYLDVTYNQFSVVSSSQGSGDEKNIIRALHTGAGDIRLPIEATMDGPPPSALSGQYSYHYYICNATSAEDAHQQILDPDTALYFSYDFCVSQCGVGGECWGATTSPNTTELNDNMASTYNNYLDLVTSTALTTLASVSVRSPLRVLTRTKYTWNRIDETSLGKARGYVTKLPGFFFSSYSNTAWNAPALVRMQDYAAMYARVQENLVVLREGGGYSPDGDDGGDGGDDGDDGGDGGDGGGGGTDPTFGEAAWRESQVDWSSDNDTRYADPVLFPASSLLNALDNDVSTVLTFSDASTPPAWFMLDLTACLSVSGVRLRLPASLSNTNLKLFDLVAATSLSGPFKTAVSGSLQPSASSWQTFTFDALSAQYWRLDLRSNQADDGTTVGVSLADVQFRIGASEFCDADLFEVDDLSVGVPKRKLLIRMVDGASKDDRTRVKNGLRNFLEDDFSVVVDTANTLESANDAAVGLQGFFTFVAALCLILIFFATWLSFDSNIRENSREFGILRSLGLSVGRVTRVYLYEAMAVVLAAFLLGTVIGMLIAISLTLQFNLFLEAPFKFVFPTLLFTFAFCMSVLVAIASSLIPSRHFAKLTIANVVKGRS